MAAATAGSTARPASTNNTLNGTVPAPGNATGETSDSKTSAPATTIKEGLERETSVRGTSAKNEKTAALGTAALHY